MCIYDVLFSLCTGPLLWHYSDTVSEPSVELSYDEIKEVITAVGFEFIVSLLDSKTLSKHQIKDLSKLLGHFIALFPCCLLTDLIIKRGRVKVLADLIFSAPALPWGNDL